MSTSPKAIELYNEIIKSLDAVQTIILAMPEMNLLIKLAVLMGPPGSTARHKFEDMVEALDKNFMDDPATKACYGLQDLPGASK